MATLRTRRPGDLRAPLHEHPLSHLDPSLLADIRIDVGDELEPVRKRCVGERDPLQGAILVDGDLYREVVEVAGHLQLGDDRLRDAREPRRAFQHGCSVPLRLAIEPSHGATIAASSRRSLKHLEQRAPQLDPIAPSDNA